MMLPETLLSIDTASNRLMLGLSRDDRWLSRQAVPCDSHRYHSALMIPAIQEMLVEAGLQAADLAALAVNLGPGSFTGIRTGIITARTMAQFLKLPVYGLNAFELIVEAQAPQATEPVSIYLDALRGRAYHAVLRWRDDGPYYDVPPAFISLESPLPRVAGQRLLCAETLSRFFPEAQPVWIDHDAFTPAAMLGLIQRHGNVFRREWPAIQPLYLQAPSITLKKAVVHSSAGADLEQTTDRKP